MVVFKSETSTSLIEFHSANIESSKKSLHNTLSTHSIKNKFNTLSLKRPHYMYRFELQLDSSIRNRTESAGRCHSYFQECSKQQKGKASSTEAMCFLKIILHPNLSPQTHLISVSPSIYNWMNRATCIFDSALTIKLLIVSLKVQL